MNKSTTLLLIVLLLLLGGCLEFDGQDVYFRYDEENDRIDAMFVYRGLFAEAGTGSSDKPMQKAIKDLQEARDETGEFTFWCNWPLSVNPSESYDPARDALLRHVEVESGGLFTDPEGLLCGYQFVRIHDASGFVQKLNTLLELAVQAGLAGGLKRFDDHAFDDETKDNVREFLRGREKMLTLEKGRIELRLPLSAADNRWAKQKLEEHFLQHMPSEMNRRRAVAQRRAQGGSTSDTGYSDQTVSIGGAELRDAIASSPSFRFFWDNEFTFERSETLTTVGIGVRGADQIHVAKAREGIYHDGLLQRLREDGEQIEDGLPDAELLRRLDAFGTRDAKLPTKLAERRK